MDYSRQFPFYLIHPVQEGVDNFIEVVTRLSIRHINQNPVLNFGIVLYWLHTKTLGNGLKPRPWPTLNRITDLHIWKVIHVSCTFLIVPALLNTSQVWLLVVSSMKAQVPAGRSPAAGAPALLKASIAISRANAPDPPD